MKRLLTRRNISIISFVMILTLGVSFTAFSQPGDPGGDEDVPITGIEWLLIGGAAFGAGRAYKKFNKKS